MKDVPTIPLKLFHALEPHICDLDLDIGILFDISHDRLTKRGGVQLSEDEAERMYHQLCAVVETSRKLKATYYGREAA